MKKIYTIGHSTREIGEFTDLLKAHGIKEIVDVRTIPRSGFNPQFNEDSLKHVLGKHEISYIHIKKLGGLRHSQKGSVNTGWRNASFRSFADYMATEDFADGLKSLEKIARKKRVAIMCAEALPWRCHRTLIADALTKRKWTVLHIMQSKKSAVPHELTLFLRVRRGKLTYPKP